MNKRVLILFLLQIIICSFVYGQTFQLANALQSNMVIQQGKPFTLWGTATAKTTILVHPDWIKNPVTFYVNEQGKWEGKIPVPDVKPGNFIHHTLTIIHQNDTIRLTNILVGEVWLCSGQSNMDFTMKPFLPWMKGVIDYKKEIAAADYPNIRLLDVKTDFKAKPANDIRGGSWEICTPHHAADFSAVAYYFGKYLFEKLNIPIGLVVSAVGGASCQAFTSRKALGADPVLYKKYLYPYDTSARSKEKLDTTVTFEKVLRPTLFYNAMIYPLRKLSIRGFIWYQGESNKDDGMLYNRLCAAMLKSWRKDFQQGYLPFYFVQMTPYNWQQHDPTADEYAKLREAQTAMLDLKNTGMAVTMDIGEPDNIHPRDKKDVGIRLAKNALYRTYAFKDIVYEGPMFAGFTTDKDTLKVSFVPESIGSGLTTSDGRPPMHFYVAGKDKIFHKGIAKIAGDQVRVYSPDVKHPVAIRYAFTNYPLTNFCNKEGLPALPFRTDKWNN